MLVLPSPRDIDMQYFCQCQAGVPHRSGREHKDQKEKAIVRGPVHAILWHQQRRTDIAHEAHVIPDCATAGDAAPAGAGRGVSGCVGACR
jgi:hypothetical protein